MMSKWSLFGGKAKRLVSALDKSLAIIEFEPTGKIIWANDNFCRLVGYHPSEIVGRHHSMFVDPQHAESTEYKEFWLKLSRGEFDHREYPRIAKGGKQVWIQASYNPVLDAAGKVVRVVKVASDTTAAHLKNVAFEAKLTAISRVQAVIEFTPTGEILDANENFLDLMGYRLHEIRGRHHRIFVDDQVSKSSEYQQFWQKLNRGQFVADEFKRRDKQGRDVWIQASYNPIFGLNNEVTSIVKFATDVTGRVRAVSEVANGLTELANSNLEHRLEHAFVPAFERLRDDYNVSLGGLQDAMRRVAESAHTIDAETQEISGSSFDMSRRIEEQAETLQQTAAVLDQITATVMRSAEGALKAALAASGARSGTAQSGQVMSQAAGVMTDIDASSEKITKIIGVIDEIAFQTNLLALNAGVEAARAGESGRGFAVVAQEVRALAQRSAVAAKEIKTLISASSDQVKRGVALVRATATSLEDVTTKVGEIDAVLSEVAKSAQEQAKGLGEVNVEVNRMDHVTRENAAMLRRATTAATRLVNAAGEMTALIGEFRIGDRDNERMPYPKLVVVEGGRPIANVS